MVKTKQTPKIMCSNNKISCQSFNKKFKQNVLNDMKAREFTCETYDNILNKAH